MSDLISREAVEKIIKEFFKTKVDEIPKREKFNKLCDLCDLYLELNADLHKEIEDIPVAYDVDKVVERLEADTEHTFHGCINKAYSIKVVKGAVKDEEEKCKFCRCARCRWQATYNCLHYRRPPCSWCGSKGNMKHSDIVGQCKRFVKRMEE